MRYLLLCFLILSACAQSKDDTPSTITKSAIAKTWVSTSPWWSVDLGNMEIDKLFTIRWYGAYGEICDSAAVATGTMTSGTMTTALSTLVDIWPTATPGCGRWDADWTYSLTQYGLEMCPTNPANPCVLFN